MFILRLLFYIVFIFIRREVTSTDYFFLPCPSCFLALQSFSIISCAYKDYKFYLPQETASSDGHHQRRGLHDQGHKGQGDQDLYRYNSMLEDKQFFCFAANF